MTRAGRSVAAALLLLAVAGPLRAQSPADSAWDAGDIERARQLYSQRLARDSSDIRALHRLALIHGWDAEYDQSLALFRRLLEVSPSNLDARVDRARVIAWTGDLDRAIDELEDVLEAEPAYLPALEALATFRAWAGEYDAALSLYDRINEAGADPGVQYQRARVLGWADRFDAALAVYDSLLAADPGDVRALLGLGQILAWSDRLDSARTVYQRVLAVDSANAEAMAGLARVTGYAGDLVESETRWRELVAADSGSVDALVGLGQVLRWQGREAAAKPYIDRALERSPGSSEAREERRWLEASLNPRAAPAFAYEWDSDGNRMVTLSGHGAWHPVPRLEVRLDLYRRSATLDNVVEDARQSTGGAVTARVQLEPGWRVTGSVGGGDPDVAGVAGAATWTVAVSTPPRNRVRATFTLGRELLDATAVLMANRVVYDQAVVHVGTRVGPWTVDGETSAAWFESLVTSNGNRRLAASGSAMRPVTPWLELGPSVRLFGFDADLTEGYFDPDLFALLEAPASVSTNVGPLDASAALVPGLLKITTGGAVRGALRTSGGLGWQAGPGRHVSLNLLYVANGASPFAQEAADYRYFALTLRARWIF